MPGSHISTGSGPAVPSGSGFPDFGFFQKSSRTMGGPNGAYKGDFGTIIFFFPWEYFGVTPEAYFAM